MVGLEDSTHPTCGMRLLTAPETGFSLTIHLSGDREQMVRSLMQNGGFSSEDEVIDEALQLLIQRQEREKSRVLEGIRQGLEDMKAGRGRPADEVFDEIRREFNLSPDA